jgi:hypothetical protein
MRSNRCKWVYCFCKDANMAYLRVLPHPSPGEAEENKENRSQNSKKSGWDSNRFLPATRVTNYCYTDLFGGYVGYTTLNYVNYLTYPRQIIIIIITGVRPVMLSMWTLFYTLNVTSYASVGTRSTLYQLAWACLYNGSYILVFQAVLRLIFGTKKKRNQHIKDYTIHCLLKICTCSRSLQINQSQLFSSIRHGKDYIPLGHGDSTSSNHIGKM